MPRFEPGRPIETTEPVVAVEGGLPEGVHRFQLVVRDQAGHESAPDVVQVSVQARVPVPAHPATRPASPRRSRS